MSKYVWENCNLNPLIEIEIFCFKIAIFTSAIYKMFEVFYQFIGEERMKSSTRTMSQMIDEWEHVFAKDVNLILLKCFMRFIQANGTSCITAFHINDQD